MAIPDNDLNDPNAYDLRTDRIDLALSRALVEHPILGASIGLCFRNAVMALMMFRDELPEGTEYVEGWVVLPSGFPIKHGWLETPDRTVVDPTLPLTTTDEALRAYRYVDARRYPRDEVKRLAVTLAKTLPLYEADGYGVYREPWYRLAEARAYGVLRADVETNEDGSGE